MSKVHTGLWATLAALIITCVLTIPNFWAFSLQENVTRVLLVFGFFFGLSLITEHAFIELDKTISKHPVNGLLTVLVSTTVMVFSFVGLALFTQ